MKTGGKKKPGQEGAMPIQFIGGHTLLKDEYKVNQLVIDFPFIMMVVGNSGAGKTDATITFLLALMIDGLIVYAKHTEGDQWQEVRRRCEKKNKKGEVTLNSYFQPDLKKVIPIKKIEFEGRMVAVFDDQQESPDPDGVIADYVFNGRHQGLKDGYGGVSTINIDQAKTGLEKASRKNTTCFLLFEGLDDEDIKHYWEICGKDLPLEVFAALYQACVAVPHGFLFVNRRAKNISGKYRFQFDCLLKGLPEVEIRNGRNLPARKEAPPVQDTKIPVPEPIALKEVESDKPIPKKRGRKPGSKNKPKIRIENEPRTA
jgi:hypothetical protein